jgi:Secretion system C-terminal sorting domain
MFTHFCHASLLTSTPKRALTQPAPTPNGVDVYPNPSSGVFQVRVESDKEARMEVLDALGKRIVAPQVVMEADAWIDLAAYPSGVYFIRIVQAGQSRVFRVVKE